ncbi:MAG: hypothetical protein ACO1N7_10100 [Sphingobacteriaceae bacterium]
METSYLPVQWEYREVIEEQISKQTSGKIFYFGQDNTVNSIEGRVVRMEDIPSKGVFIQLDTNEQVRIDRIITLFGKPGAAYDEYDAYANACMDCMGGYNKDELDSL